MYGSNFSFLWGRGGSHVWWRYSVAQERIFTKLKKKNNSSWIRTHFPFFSVQEAAWGIQFDHFRASHLMVYQKKKTDERWLFFFTDLWWSSQSLSWGERGGGKLIVYTLSIIFCVLCIPTLGRKKKKKVVPPRYKTHPFIYSLFRLLNLSTRSSESYIYLH